MTLAHPWRALLYVLCVGVCAFASPALAQGPTMEEPDATRLDVERLPPEAIEITRDMYSHGFLLEAHIGVRGFVGGVGRFSKVGPYAQIALGYEITNWLHANVLAEGSMHATDAPTPPSSTVFDLFGFMGQLRLQANISARAALFLTGEFGIAFSTSPVLETYGLSQATDIGLVYGGQAGFDWHMRNRHHSIGFLGGARVHPGLEGADGELALGVHGTLYLRYAF